MQPRCAANTSQHVADDRAVDDSTGIVTAAIEPAGGGSRT